MSYPRLMEMEAYLKKCRQTLNYKDCFNMLFRNNDYIEHQFLSDNYSYMMNFGKDLIDAEYETKRLENEDLYKLYEDTIGISRDFISQNCDTDTISLYAAISSFIKNAAFKGKDRINKSLKFKDYVRLLGLDVILGRSCCRHKAYLYKNIMSGFVDTKALSVGPEENQKSNHSIVCTKYGNKYLLLDSTIPLLYFPIEKFLIYGNNLDFYVKSSNSYVYEGDFDNIEEFFNFFSKLFNNTKLSEEEYSKIFNEIIDKYWRYVKEKSMARELSLRLEPSREMIRKLIK